jgi:hypothetical protein
MEDATNSCGRDEAGPALSSRTKNGPCSRCDAARSYAVTRQRLLCKPCFISACGLTFNKALQQVKLRQKRVRTSLIIGFSGGPVSSTLLEFMAQLLRADPRQVMFTVHVAWVDTLDVLPSLANAEPAHAIRERIARTCAELGMPLRVIPLHTFLSEDGPTGRTQLARVFSAPPTQQHHPLDVTWKEELLDHMVRALLVRFAHESGVKTIVTGETMTRLWYAKLALHDVPCLTPSVKCQIGGRHLTRSRLQCRCDGGRVRPMLAGRGERDFVAPLCGSDICGSRAGLSGDERHISFWNSVLCAPAAECTNQPQQRSWLDGGLPQQA